MHDRAVDQTENESCVVCHGDDRVAGVDVVHDDAIALLDESDEVEILGVNVDTSSGLEVSIDFDFSVSYTDVAGNPIWVNPFTPRSNVTQLDYVRFSLAKFVPGANGSPDSWLLLANAERYVANLVENADGSYTYTWTTDMSADWDSTVTTRAVIQVYHLDGIAPINKVYDFVPDGASAVVSHKVVDESSCNSCHGELIFHGGRTSTDFCSVCHNSGMTNVIADMTVMIHSLHASVDGNALWGFPATDDFDFSGVTYPQEVNNCRTCHDGENALTPEGGNWETMPNIRSCGGCHIDVEFDTGVNHAGGVQADDANCALCHNPTGTSPIEEAHMTEDSSPGNPMVPDGAWEIEYVLSEARVDASTNVLEVDFSILADGTELDMLNLPAALADEGRYPGFLFAYAMPQGGIDAPADWNNIGESGGAAGSMSIEDVITGGNLADAGSGLYTATIADAFPVGATMRAVALQGYFRQTNPDGGYWSRHTQSVQVPVTDDDVRRVVVDQAKCLSCHDMFLGHGGNRVNDPMVCAFCHVPTKSTGGRGVDPAGLPQATIDAVGSDPLVFPEDSNNLKDMIHGIHGSDVREIEFEFVRNRNGGLYYNWAEVTFPREDGVQDCMACHLSGTYGADLADDVLPSNIVTTDGVAADGAAITAARASVPNATDLVSSPTAAACYACHASEVAEAHIEQNGGIIAEVRSESGL